jgi:hypothetical protein
MSRSRSSRREKQQPDLRSMNLNRKSDSHQIAMNLFSKTVRTTEETEPLPIKRESVSGPHPDNSDHLNWEMVAFWSFVISTFAALIIAFYVLWTKCNTS